MSHKTINAEIIKLLKKFDWSVYDLENKSELSHMTWYNYIKPDAFIKSIDVRVLDFLLNYLTENELKELVLSHIKAYAKRKKERVPAAQ